MRGKRSDWTKEDVLAFAKDNGIVGAERIINEVADSLTHFRELAQKNGAEPQWINCIETVINHHLLHQNYNRDSSQKTDRHFVTAQLHLKLAVFPLKLLESK